VINRWSNSGCIFSISVATATGLNRVSKIQIGRAMTAAIPAAPTTKSESRTEPGRLNIRSQAQQMMIQLIDQSNASIAVRAIISARRRRA